MEHLATVIRGVDERGRLHSRPRNNIGGMKGFKSSIKSVLLLIKHKNAEDQIRSRTNQLKGTTYNKLLLSLNHLLKNDVFL